MQYSPKPSEACPEFNKETKPLNLLIISKLCVFYAFVYYFYSNQIHCNYRNAIVQNPN